MQARNEKDRGAAAFCSSIDAIQIAIRVRLRTTRRVPLKCGSERHGGFVSSAAPRRRKPSSPFQATPARDRCRANSLQPRRKHLHAWTRPQKRVPASPHGTITTGDDRICASPRRCTRAASTAELNVSTSLPSPLLSCWGRVTSAALLQRKGTMSPCSPPCPYRRGVCPSCCAGTEYHRVESLRPELTSHSAASASHHSLLLPSALTSITGALMHSHLSS